MRETRVLALLPLLAYPLAVGCGQSSDAGLKRLQGRWMWHRKAAPPSTALPATVEGDRMTILILPEKVKNPAQKSYVYEATGRIRLQSERLLAKGIKTRMMFRLPQGSRAIAAQLDAVQEGADLTAKLTPAEEADDEILFVSADEFHLSDGDGFDRIFRRARPGEARVEDWKTSKTP